MLKKFRKFLFGIVITLSVPLCICFIYSSIVENTVDVVTSDKALDSYDTEVSFSRNAFVNSISFVGRNIWGGIKNGCSYIVDSAQILGEGIIQDGQSAVDTVETEVENVLSENEVNEYLHRNGGSYE